jgi:hypothetical protein
MQFGSGLRDGAHLVPAAGKLVLARLPLRVEPGDRCRAVRYAAGDLVNFHPAGEPVVQSDHRHAEVEQVGYDVERRRLLAAVLRR